MSQDEQKEIVDRYVAKLLEHFDSVQIFVTVHDGGVPETVSIDSGGGNLYARIGKVREWLLFQEQYVINFAAKKAKSK